MTKRFIITIFLYFLVPYMYAQQSQDDSLLNMLEQMQQQSSEQSSDTAEIPEEDYKSEAEEPVDTFLTIHPIFILPDTVRAWKSRKEFAYVNNLDSVLQALQQQEENKKPANINPPDISFIDKIFNGPVLKFVLWTMAGIFVLIIIFQLAKNKGFFKGTVSNGAVLEEETNGEEDVLEQNFDKLLQQAQKQGDYRLAVRYHFLKTLQRLRDRQLIEFAADKTNSRYVYEVPQKWQSDFASLVLNYEYVWYGKFTLNADQYNLLQKKYNSFNEKI
jgi:hypothetical protein